MLRDNLPHEVNCTSDQPCATCRLVVILHKTLDSSQKEVVFNEFQSQLPAADQRRLQQKVADSDLPRRVINSLVKSYPNLTIENLLQLDLRDLYRIPRFGKGSMRELQNWIKKQGFSTPWNFFD